ncbi:hypothetical protein ACU4GH_22575 [Bradyrhizobium betae]
MVNFGRQVWLDGRPFETLADAIKAKDPDDVQAILSFDADAVTGSPRADDLLHDEIEWLRASPEFQTYLARAQHKPELSEREAAAYIQGMGPAVSVVVHDNGLVTATALVATHLSAAERLRIQNEVDQLLTEVQRKYRVVRKKRPARWRSSG